MPCPVCRADNEDRPTCRRCRADLSLLWAVEDQRREYLRSARGCLRRRQYEQALEQVRHANELRRGQDADQLAALAHLLGGNFAEALKCHRIACATQ